MCSKSETIIQAAYLVLNHERIPLNPFIVKRFCSGVCPCLWLLGHSAWDKTHYNINIDRLLKKRETVKNNPIL